MNAFRVLYLNITKLISESLHNIRNYIIWIVGLKDHGIVKYSHTFVKFEGKVQRVFYLVPNVGSSKVIN